MIKCVDFSIVIPCYNQEAFLKEALISVMQQNYENWECIIVNDGSSDNSERIIDEFIVNDKRFKKINQKNQGLAASRNNGIRMATGTFILPLDGDDKIGPDYLRLAKKAFTKNPKLKIVYAKAFLFGTKNEHWNLPKYDYQTILFVNCIYCSAIYKKEDFLKTEGYDLNMKHGYEDWEFWLQLLNPYDQVLQLNSVQFYYRQRMNSMISFVKSEEKRKLMEHYIFKKHIVKYRDLFRNGFSLENMMKINYQLNALESIKKTISYKFFYKIERKIRKIFKQIC